MIYSAEKCGMVLLLVVANDLSSFGASASEYLDDECLLKIESSKAWLSRLRSKQFTVYNP